MAFGSTSPVAAVLSHVEPSALESAIHPIELRESSGFRLNSAIASSLLEITYTLSPVVATLSAPLSPGALESGQSPPSSMFVDWTQLSGLESCVSEPGVCACASCGAAAKGMVTAD